MLHVALLGSAALLGINNSFAEDRGLQNSRVVISAVFAQPDILSTDSSDSSAVKSDPVKENNNTASEEENETTAFKTAEESTNNLTDDKAASNITEQQDGKEETVKNTSLSETYNENRNNRKTAGTEDRVSSGAIPETLPISSFKTDLRPVYPEFARKNNYEGLIRVSLNVNRQGKGENVKIVKSSGYSVLDKAALKAVRKATFKAKTSRIYYLSADLNKPLVVDINFSLTDKYLKS